MKSNYFLKLAEDTDRRVFYKKHSKSGSVFIKAPGQRVFILGKTVDGDSRWWVVSANGIIEFSEPDKALDAFFGISNLLGVSNMKISSFVRKSSHDKFASSDKVKVASLIKNALCYDGDAWISNPEELIHTSSQDLWAITTNGKHVARLFDEREFPLNV